MARDTDNDWKKISEEHPYWGVLSDPQFRGTELSDEGRRNFFSSGDRFIKKIVGFVRHHVAEDFKIDRALDFGCGVGRLLVPLAKISNEAVGVDIAPRMLELTRENLAIEGLSNGFAIQGNDELTTVTGTFNFVNSYIVFQHIPPERGMRMIERLLGLLVIGGVFSLQVTFAKERRFFTHEQQSASYYRKVGSMIQTLIPTEDLHPKGTITMYDYDLNELMLIVGRVAGEPLLVLPTNHDGHIGVHLVGLKARAFS
jgi:SAM-dependent methyltransferase